MNKIIFLDIDGVLNTEYYQDVLQYKANLGKMNMVLYLTPKPLLV